MFGSLKINNDTPAMPDMLTFTFEMIPSLPLSEGPGLVSGHKSSEKGNENRPK